MCIINEKPSLPKDLEAYHKNVQYAESYVTQVSWYLAWEQFEDNIKNFRLFLVGEDKEIVCINACDNPRWIEFQSKTIFKKPLIETDLQTRLKYAESLNPFFNQFAEYLKKCRFFLELENSNI